MGSTSFALVKPPPPAEMILCGKSTFNAFRVFVSVDKVEVASGVRDAVPSRQVSWWNVSPPKPGLLPLPMPMTNCQPASLAGLPVNASAACYEDALISTATCSLIDVCLSRHQTRKFSV